MIVLVPEEEIRALPHSEKEAIGKSGRGSSPDTESDGTLILDLQPPEL